MKSGIYKITNNFNHHLYIGQSIHIQKRWKEHQKSFKENKRKTVLQKAFHKYGFENFSFEVVEECEPDKLNEREMFYIAALKPEYNMNIGGTGNKGYKVPDETKKLLSKLGRKQWESYDEETRRKIISKQLTGPRKGEHRSEETKKLLAEKTRDYFRRNGGMSEDQKRSISKALKGKLRPNDTRNLKPVVAISESGMRFYFLGIKYASIILEINYSEIAHCIRGDRKRAGGFSWEYCSQETIHNWSRAELITARSAVHPNDKDEDIVQAIAKNKSYGVTDKGLIALARRSNTIKTIAAEVIHENDIFDCELASGRSIHHKIDIFKERGEVVAYYCLVELSNGGEQFKVMSKKEVENHRKKFSKANNPNDKENIWNKNFDAMALKTCVIQALKLCPISIEALDAVVREEKEDIKESENITEGVEYTISDESAETIETPAIEDKTPDVSKTMQPPVEQPKPETTATQYSFDDMNGLSEEEMAQADEAFDETPTNVGDIF